MDETDEERILRDPYRGFTPEQLLGFDTLIPPKPKKRSLIGTLLALPFRILLLPVRLAIFLLTLPLRPFRRSSGDSSS